MLGEKYYKRFKCTSKKRQITDTMPMPITIRVSLDRPFSENCTSLFCGALVVSVVFRGDAITMRMPKSGDSRKDNRKAVLYPIFRSFATLPMMCATTAFITSTMIMKIVVIVLFFIVLTNIRNISNSMIKNF